MFAACVKPSCGNRGLTWQDDCPVGWQWSQREVVAPMWSLHLIAVHSFFMAATPSVLPHTPGIPARHRIARKIVREAARCSSPAGSWRQMAPPHQVDLSPPSWPPWQVGVPIAGRGSRGLFALQSSSRWQVRIPSCPYQAMTAGMSLSSGKEDTQ